jgi:hypothetical protein
MLGVSAGPQAKAVVVFGRQDQPFHSRVFSRRRDLVGIEIRRIEYRFAFVAVAPLFVGERIYGEVDETVKLHFMPAELARGGDGAEGLRGSNGFAGDKGSKASRCRADDRQNEQS